MSYKSRFPDEKAMVLYEQGLNDREIGESLGFGSTTVFTWRLKNSLPSQMEIQVNKKKRENPISPLASAEKEYLELGYRSYGEYQSARFCGNVKYQKPIKSTNCNWNWWAGGAE